MKRKSFIIIGAAAAAVVIAGIGALVIGPSEHPVFAKAVKDCVQIIRDGGPMMVKVANDDPEGYCRAQLKPAWDRAMLRAEQAKFEATKNGDKK